ncbi:MAG: hypothetical protein LRY73_17330 [Bacillus sp. (in: Bacteria)]|nr:hypothetical protein [Bacillus sp. (in: firmicutes)]
MQPLLKFCGIRCYEDYKKAVESGVDYIGFIFAPSKRKVTISQVNQWKSKKKIITSSKNGWCFC